MAIKDVARELLALLKQGGVEQYRPQAQSGGGPPAPPAPPSAPQQQGVEQYIPQQREYGREFDARYPSGRAGEDQSGQMDYDPQMIAELLSSAPNFGAWPDPEHNAVEIPAAKERLDMTNPADYSRLLEYRSGAQAQQAPTDQELWAPYEEDAKKAKARKQIEDVIGGLRKTDLGLGGKRKWEE